MLSFELSSVKTDYHGNFKWGVRHNVGRGYGGHGGYGHGK